MAYRQVPTIVTVPGLHSSGPSHWQSLWERNRADVVRADLGMWERPHRNTWVTKLDQTIRTARAPVVLAAHSLGCLAVAWWATWSGQPYGWPVAGALLVAPADVDRHDAPVELAGFAPSPRTLLTFPSIVVASDDDAWITPSRARSLAAQWGASFVDAGPLGHINAASGIGDWAEGWSLMESLIGASSDATTTPAEAARRLREELSERPRAR